MRQSSAPTYLCEKMMDEQQRTVTAPRGDLMMRQLRNDWSQPFRFGAMLPAIRRTGTAFCRSMEAVRAWDRAGQPGRDSSAHELCDDDREALDSFMAGGL